MHDIRRRETTLAATRLVRYLALLVPALLAACDHDAGVLTSAAGARPTASPPTSLSSAGLTTRVEFSAAGAEAAAVLLQQVGGGERLVPASLEAGHATTVVTSLEPSATYVIWGLAIRGADTVRSRPDTVVVDPLPSALRGVRFVTTAPDTVMGYTLTTFPHDSTLYALAFDRTGRIVWYRAFIKEGTALGDFQQQPNGNFTVFVGTTNGWQPEPGKFVEITPDGRVVREYLAPAGTYVDNHDFRMRPDGKGGMEAYMFTYTFGQGDMTGHGGGIYATVAGHQIVRFDANGGHRIVFDAWSRFSPRDWISLPFLGPNDFDHPNSLDFDTDGGLLVSWRNMNAVTKHHPVTGAVLWQLGGIQRTVELQDDPDGGFSGQHSARAVGASRYLVYDNGNNRVPEETRVAEYAVDLASGTARLVWEYRHDPPIFTGFAGSVQRLADGRTFVGYTNGHATMLAADGSVQWEEEFTNDGAPLFTYRMLRVPSLTSYRVP